MERLPLPTMQAAEWMIGLAVSYHAGRHPPKMMPLGITPCSQLDGKTSAIFY